MTTQSYIKSLLIPNGKQPKGRKVWSLDLETVWLPFFTATNTEGLTLIPNEALGAPLRLAYDADGAVRFSPTSGKPVIKVAKELAEGVKLVRENFVAGLQAHILEVIAERKEAYTEQARLNAEAGKPIIDKDRQSLETAVALAVAQALDEAEAKAVAKAKAEDKATAEASAKAEFEAVIAEAEAVVAEAEAVVAEAEAVVAEAKPKAKRNKAKELVTV